MNFIGESKETLFDVLGYVLERQYPDLQCKLIKRIIDWYLHYEDYPNLEEFIIETRKLLDKVNIEELYRERKIAP